MSPLAPRHRRRIAIAIAAFTLLGVTASPAIGGPLPDPLVATDGNLLNNPSFENKDLTNGTPVSWSPQQATAGTAKVVTGNADAVHSGKGALQVVDSTTADNVLLRSSPVPAQPGISYTARAWVRNSSGSTAWLYLEFWGVGTSRLAAWDARPAAGDRHDARDRIRGGPVRDGDRRPARRDTVVVERADAVGADRSAGAVEVLRRRCGSLLVLDQLASGAPPGAP